MVQSESKITISNLDVRGMMFARIQGVLQCLEQYTVILTLKNYTDLVYCRNGHLDSEQFGRHFQFTKN